MKRYALPLLTGFLALFLAQLAGLVHPPLVYILVMVAFVLAIATIIIWRRMQ